MGAGIAQQLPSARSHAPILPPAGPDEVGRLLDRAHAAFHRRESPNIWGTHFQSVLDILQGEENAPRRIEVLTQFGCRLVEDCEHRPRFLRLQGMVAHEYLLEAVCHLDLLAPNHPALARCVLNQLWNLEWKLARVEDSTPNSGLFFNLALVHYDLAPRLGNPWGQMPTSSAEPLAEELEIVATRWTSMTALQAEWDHLHQMGPVDPMLELMLLGLAACCGHEAFIDAHIDALNEDIGEDSNASVGLQQFHLELEELELHVDAAAHREVITPWMELVECFDP